MIHAVYHRKFNRLTVEGHARSAEPGHDLVCAAASTLAYTLAHNVMGLEDGGQIRKAPVIELEEGKAEVCVSPRSNFRSVVVLIFDTICAGFSLLAHDYPEYITYEIRE